MSILELILFFPSAIILYAIIYAFINYTTDIYVDRYMENMYGDDYFNYD